MTQGNATVSTFLALRSFFLSATAGDMESAYCLLAEGDTEAPLVDDWTEIEFAFNRLFVGPSRVQAPPYASVYLDPQPDLMGSTALRARELYHEVGLVSPWENSIPDDHIGLELDACWQIEASLAQNGSDELHRHYQAFRQHLSEWVPLFTRRVRSAPSVPAAIAYVVGRLDAALSN